MGQTTVARVLGGLLAVASAVPAWGQTGYQYEQLAPDPVLKTPATLESMSMRAGYEQRHRDCLDAGFHLDAVLAARPDWAGALELRLFCERQENRRVDEMADLTGLVELQPENWKRWFDRATLHQENLELEPAIEDLNEAIKLRWWEINLYAQRCRWEEEREEYASAFADAEKVHQLVPSWSVPVKEMARLAVKAGRGEGDVARYLKLAEIGDPKPEDSPRSDDDLSTDGMGSEELMLRAGYALRQRKAEQELRFLNAALVRQPGLMSALERRVQIAMFATQEQRMNSRLFPLLNPRKDVDTLISLDPKRPDYYRLRIELRSLRSNWYLYSYSEKPEATLQDYGMIILLEPHEGKNYVDRADFRLQMKNPDLDAAIEDYRQAIDLEPGNARYCYKMAQAYARNKAQLTEALALNWALIGEPDNAAWLKERAKLP
jgi:tetratricopeptide (TPR) repeat protein